MLLRINWETDRQGVENIKEFLSLANLICLKGEVPTPEEIKDPERFGKWWRQEGGSFYLVCGGNNAWLHTRQKGDGFMDVEFSFRYDRDNIKKDAISNTMIAFLDFVSPV